MVQKFQRRDSRERSERIRNTEKEALLEAKEENQKYRSEIESELKESRLELKSQENRLIQRNKRWIVKMTLLKNVKAHGRKRRETWC